MVIFFFFEPMTMTGSVFFYEAMRAAFMVKSCSTLVRNVKCRLVKIFSRGLVMREVSSTF